jgi:hypothetical protein
LHISIQKYCKILTKCPFLTILLSQIPYNHSSGISVKSQKIAKYCKSIALSSCAPIPLGLVKKLGFVLAPARTRLARKQNAGLLVGSPSFADTASRSRSQTKMEDNLFTSP